MTAKDDAINAAADKLKELLIEDMVRSIDASSVGPALHGDHDALYELLESRITITWTVGK